MLGHSPQVITNGLLFYYDMGNPQKSWKGAPTTNLSSTGNIYTNWNNSGTAIWTNNDNSISRLFQDIQVNSILQTTDGNSHIGIGNGLITAGNWVSSVYVYIPSSAGTLSGSVPYFRSFPANTSRGELRYNGNGDWNTWSRNQWIRIERYWNNTANDTSMYISCYTNITNNKIYFTAPQLEQKFFATPFVNGTRSNTQAILDLVGNNMITANEGVTYLNNGMFELLPSNSNSTLTIPLSTSLNKPTGTISAWVYPKGYSLSNGIFVNRDNSTPNALDWLWIGSWGSGSIFYFRLGNGSDCCSQDLTVNNWTTVCPVNTWTNITVTWQSANFSRIYRNGALIASRTITSIPNTNPSSTGRIGLGHDSSGTGSWNGLISNFSIFNRALSATEVQQNFNALRGRYGL